MSASSPEMFILRLGNPGDGRVASDPQARHDGEVHVGESDASPLPDDSPECLYSAEEPRDKLALRSAASRVQASPGTAAPAFSQGAVAGVHSSRRYNRRMLRECMSAVTMSIPEIFTLRLGAPENRAGVWSSYPSDCGNRAASSNNGTSPAPYRTQECLYSAGGPEVSQV